jgi:hypothetical protein
MDEPKYLGFDQNKKLIKRNRLRRILKGKEQNNN